MLFERFANLDFEILQQDVKLSINIPVLPPWGFKAARHESLPMTPSNYLLSKDIIDFAIALTTLKTNWFSSSLTFLIIPGNIHKPTRLLSASVWIDAGSMASPP